MRNDHIALRIAHGHRKIARQLGKKATQYRPLGPLSLMGEVYASIMMVHDMTPDFSFTRIPLWGNVTEYMLTDHMDDIALGDIILCDKETFFVASINDYRPLLCVVCNQTVCVEQSDGFGERIITDCPISIFETGKGEGVGNGIPGELKPTQFLGYFPHICNDFLKPYMVVIMKDGSSYTISTVEKSQFGTRCLMTAQQI
ncbi:hypothetical protein [Swingsia samuiensis]|uniref:Uncharacterized protein n=1 Tax=Swingsia samuiensis TaxID=1293412 RepID=A0A4Y6UJH9_9PROT|nr:hypothetical protein [Swingsia samuiensis]QDH16788.1 hypothetical protein E3D00_03795 [Swingsia samuiensis]